SRSCFFFFSSRRRHTRFSRDWSSDVCSSDLLAQRNPTIPALNYNSHPKYRLTRAVPQSNQHPLTAPGIHLFANSYMVLSPIHCRSEERRVGKECRSRWTPYHDRKKNYSVTKI